MTVAVKERALWLMFGVNSLLTGWNKRLKAPHAATENGVSFEFACERHADFLWPSCVRFPEKRCKRMQKT